MTDRASFDRSWDILRRLSGCADGITVGDLAKQTGVSLKTIRRTLKQFADNGIPLEESVGPKGRKSWRVTGTYGDGAFQVRFDEAASIYLGLKLLHPWMGTLVGQAATELGLKLTKTLSRQVRKYLDRVPDLLHVAALGPSQYADKSELIDLLMQAAEDHSVVRLTYQSRQATEPVTYEIHCYGLMQYRGALYMAAFAPHHGAVRHYKIDRVEAVEITGKKFSRPSEFDLATHLSGAFGIFRRNDSRPIFVRIQFDRDVARYVREKQWHSSQRLTDQVDGSLIAEFELTATEEIKAWALSFGSKAEVLDPKSLREEIAAELQQLTQRYSRVSVAPKLPRKRRAK